MPHSRSLLPSNDTDQTNTQAPDMGTLLLLDTQYTILAGRPPQAQPLGDTSLLSHFSIPDGELAAVRAHLESHSTDVLLIQSRETPLLLLCGALSATGKLLLLIPPARLIRALIAPTLYLSEPSHLRFSPASLTALASADEALYQPLAEWLSVIGQLFSAVSTSVDSISYAPSVIAQRASRLASLCDVELDLDLDGIGPFPLPDADFDAFTGHLATILLLAKRAALTPCVELFIEREGPDAPVAHAVLHLRHADDTLPELCGAEDFASLRGNLFLATRVPSEPSLLHIRFTFSHKELSLQEMRNRFMMHTI